MPDDLASLEALAVDLYSPVSSPTARNTARLSLSPVASSPNALPQCHVLLQRSSAPEALLFACNTLYELISAYFSKLSVSDIRSLQNSIIVLLKSTQPLFVRSSAIRLLCRLTKLTWLEHNEHREILEQIIVPIISQQAQLGLQILDELVVEFFTNTPTMSLINNRRAAANFRLSFLHEIACISLEMIVNPSVRAYAIRTLCRALTANSTLSLPEESLDDGGSLMLSDKWTETIANPQTLEKLIDLSAQAPEVIEVIATMARIRRSLWPNTAREGWVKAMLQATEIIAKRLRAGLAFSEAHVLFAQLLMNLKMTFQLSDFVAVTGVHQWFSYMGDITSLIWGASINQQSTLSLLKFWSGVAKARRTPASSAVEQEVDRQIATLALRFLELQCEAHYRSDNDNQIVIEEELDCFAILFHHDYNVMLPAFNSHFDKALLNQGVHCLAWLAALSTHIIAQQKTPTSGELRGKIDACITFRMLQLLQEPCFHKIRSVQAQLVLFLDEIRHCYFMDRNRVFSEQQQKAINAFYAHLAELCSRTISMEIIVTLVLPALGRLISTFGILASDEDHLVAEEAAELIVDITTGPAGQSVLRDVSLSSMLLSLIEETSSLSLRTKLAACWSHCLISNCPEFFDEAANLPDQCVRFLEARLTELLSCWDSKHLRGFSEADLTALFCDLNGMAHAVQAHSKFQTFWLFLEPYTTVFATIVPFQKSMSFKKASMDFVRTITNHNTCDPFGPVSSDGLRLVRCLAPMLQTFAESLVQRSEAGNAFSFSFVSLSPREAGSPLPSPSANGPTIDEDLCEYLEMYFDAIAGILSGNWVQTGAMELYGDMTACNLTSQAIVVMVRGAVSFSDLLSISSIKRSVVQLIVILSEMYVKDLMRELTVEERQHFVMSLLSLSLQRKDDGAITCLASLMSVSNFVSENDAAQVFEMLLDAVLFESVDIAKFSQPLFPLIIRQPNGCLSSYRSRILKANTSCEASVTVCFNELTQGLYPKMSATKVHLATFTHNVGKARAILNKSGIYSPPVIKTI